MSQQKPRKKSHFKTVALCMVGAIFGGPILLLGTCAVLFAGESGSAEAASVRSSSPRSKAKRIISVGDKFRVSDFSYRITEAEYVSSVGVRPRFFAAQISSIRLWLYGRFDRSRSEIPVARR